MTRRASSATAAVCSVKGWNNGSSKKRIAGEEIKSLRIIDETTWIQFSCNLGASYQAKKVRLLFNSFDSVLISVPKFEN